MSLFWCLFLTNLNSHNQPDHNSGEVNSLVNGAAIVTEQSVPRREDGGERRRRDERQEEGRRAAG